MPPPLSLKKKSFANIILGLEVRGSIKNIDPLETRPEYKHMTFRIRPIYDQNTGKLLKKIQQRYPYTVSDPNADHTGSHNKDRMRTAMSLWVSLPDNQKDWYKRKAAAMRRGVSGQNLYARDYFRANP